MDNSQAATLRDLLCATGMQPGWVEESGEFGAALRRAPRQRGGLLLTGPADEEPWHFAAHLSDESRWAEIPQLAPVLVRHRPVSGSPDHLTIGLERLAASGRGEALVVVSEFDPGDQLLEQVADARRRGTRVLALDRRAPRLRDLAHESLSLPEQCEPLDLDAAQHLVSLAATAAFKHRTGVRERWGRWVDAVNGPRVEPW
jgi:hypothetical protein